MKRVCLILALIAVLPAVSGCNLFGGLRTRCKVRDAAEDAWERFEESHDCIDYEDDIEKGFRAGYASFVMKCRPQLYPVPPRCYRGSWYQTCFGRHEVEAWREGFLFGQSIASRDCMIGLDRKCLGPDGAPCGRRGCQSCGGGGRHAATLLGGGSRCASGTCANGQCASGTCGTGLNGPHELVPTPVPAPGALYLDDEATELIPHEALQSPGEVIYGPTGMVPAPQNSTVPQYPSVVNGTQLPVPPEPAPPQTLAAPAVSPPRLEVSGPTNAPNPTAQLELPAPTATDVSVEEAVKDPPQTEVPSKSSSVDRPAQLKAPLTVPDAGSGAFVLPAPAPSESLVVPGAPSAPSKYAEVTAPAGAEGEFVAPSLTTESAAPTTNAPVTLDLPSDRPNDFGGQESLFPGKPPATSAPAGDDPFQDPLPAGVPTTNIGWKPLDWKRVRNQPLPTQTTTNPFERGEPSSNAQISPQK